jgi:hypothetical protein
MAMTARLASQPYPIVSQRTKTWVEGLDNAPQETVSAASVADPMDEEEDYREQWALAEQILSERYAATLGGVLYEETVASSMHTASMHEGDGDATSEAVMKNDEGSVNVQSLRPMYNWDGGAVGGVVKKIRTARSITSPPRVSRQKGKKNATRRAVLDEDYDGETARPVTVGRVSFDDDTIYLPSGTAVESKQSILIVTFLILTLLSRITQPHHRLTARQHHQNENAARRRRARGGAGRPE